MDDIQPPSGSFITRLDRKWIALLLICVVITLAGACLIAANLLITGSTAIGLGATGTRTATSTVNEKTAESLDNPGIAFDGRYTRMAETLTAAVDTTDTGAINNTDTTATLDPFGNGAVGSATPYLFNSTPTPTTYVYRSPTPYYGGYVFPTNPPYYFPTSNTGATLTANVARTRTATAVTATWAVIRTMTHGPTASQAAMLTSTYMATQTLQAATYTAAAKTLNAPSPTPATDRIAYSAVYNGHPSLLAVNLDGSGFTAVASNDAGVLLNDWAHDRTRLIYEVGGATPNLYTVLAIGGPQTPLPGLPGGTNSQAAYSPNGNWIAFRNQDTHGGGGIYAITTDGTNTLRRLTNEVNDQQPDWTPDSHRVVFIRNADVYIVDATVALATPKQLTASADWVESYPHFSPRDETALLIDAGNVAPGSIPQIFKATYNSSNNAITALDYAQPLVDGANGTDSSWSWDGERIIFLNNGNIFTMNKNGGGGAQLIAGPVTRVRWMP